jgi:hypothetical protein
MDYKKIILIISGVILLLAGGRTQSLDQIENSSKEDALWSYVESLEDSTASILPPQLKPVYQEDSTALSKYYESLARYFEYRISGYQHREKVFSWQLFSSKVIFYCVLFLLIVGVYFSYLQFRKAIKAEGNGDLKTDLEASAQGVKVSSPVLGVIILVISLVFFYLYLVYIYPIQEIF